LKTSPFQLGLIGISLEALTEPLVNMVLKEVTILAARWHQDTNTLWLKVLSEGLEGVEEGEQIPTYELCSSEEQGNPAWWFQETETQIDFTALP